MRILALDIGAGTEDILLYDDKKQRIENCVKMVLPSPHRILADEVKKATRLSQDLFVKGDTIGGGILASALKRHIEKGLRVVMTTKSAYTIRNVLQEVKELGIEVVSEEKTTLAFEGKTLNLQEVNLTMLEDFLNEVQENLSYVDTVAVAVQDHGVYPKEMNNRRFRIQKMKELLEANPHPESLAFWRNKVPPCFLRMKSVIQASRRQLPKARTMVMDTAPAAILGCLEDTDVADFDPILAINVGNGHTMAAIISGGKILGVMEHHTRLLTTQKIERLIVKFSDGTLSNEEVFEDNGHGLFFLTKPPGFKNIERIIVTGPNRKILTKGTLPLQIANPAGDVMMTGPIGLVRAVKTKRARSCSKT